MNCASSQNLCRPIARHVSLALHSTSGESLYEALGLQKGATEDEIKRAYKKVTAYSIITVLSCCLFVLYSWL